MGRRALRVVGALGRLTAVAITATVLGLAVQVRWAGSIVLPVVAVSLAPRLVELPQARIGLVLNGVLVLTLRHPTLGAGAMRWQHYGDIARARLDASAHGSTDTFTSASIDLSAEIEDRGLRTEDRD